MVDIKKVTDGMTGSEAAQIIYGNDSGLNSEIIHLDSELKEKVDTSERYDLFKEDKLDVFPNKYKVRRYISNTDVTDYEAGYSQTNAPDGLLVAIPQNGSTVIKHHILTGQIFSKEQTLEYTFTILTNTHVMYVGIGYIASNGDYMFYGLGNGYWRKFVNFDQVSSVAASTALATNDIVKLILTDSKIKVYKNDVFVLSEDVTGEYTGELLISQVGFGSYKVNRTVKSDAIREYINAGLDEVDEKLAGKIDSNERYDLFAEKEIHLFPGLLPVRRYTSTTAYNEYAEGYSQQATENGVYVTIASSGSQNITHHLKTGLVRASQKKYICETILESNIAGGQLGFGYIAENGDYIQYLYSISGVWRKSVNFGSTSITGIIQALNANDVVKFELSGNVLNFYINDVLIWIQDVTGEYMGELLISQAGFCRYISKIIESSDVVRDYVKEQIKDSASFPQGFYSYNHSLKTFYAFTHIAGEFYGRAEIIHEESEEKYQDYWRLIEAGLYKYDSANIKMNAENKVLLQDGENECVWKRSAASDDFTGGYHGDELVTDVQFYADGINIGMPTDDIPLTKCSSFRYIEESTMHKTAQNGITDHAIECYHTKVTDIINGGYKTFNRLKWAVTGVVSLWYHGISCIGKDTATRCYTESNFTERIFDGTQPVVEEIGFREMYGYNAEKGLSSFVTSKLIIPADRDSTCTYFINDRAGDSKYYRKVSAFNPSIGEVMESEMIVRFNINL